MIYEAGIKNPVAQDLKDKNSLFSKNKKKSLNVPSKDYRNP
jgi:hypothetical protein